VVHLHDSGLPCDECSLTWNEDNLLSLSYPPGSTVSTSTSRSTASLKGKKSKSAIKPRKEPDSSAVQQVKEEESKPIYLDRARLRRQLYSTNTGTSSSREASPSIAAPVVPVQVIESSGRHAPAMSTMRERAGLGSERLVSAEERAAESQKDWRVIAKDRARDRFNALD